jgi:hypothetical protein
MMSVSLKIGSAGETNKLWHFGPTSRGRGATGKSLFLAFSPRSTACYPWRSKIVD